MVHENQSVLVTGGCGFIARAVCLLLQRQGSQPAVANPRRLDCSRFEEEFNLRPEPIVVKMRRAAERLND